MKLLFDQNLSFRLVSKLKKDFPEAQQVRSLALENANDQKIWSFARENNYTIVTFDADFLDLAQLRGIPPKIIWLRVGNMSTNTIAQVLQNHKKTIERFCCDDEWRQTVCLEIT